MHPICSTVCACTTARARIFFSRTYRSRPTAATRVYTDLRVPNDASQGLSHPILGSVPTLGVCRWRTPKGSAKKDRRSMRRAYPQRRVQRLCRPVRIALGTPPTRSSLARLPTQASCAPAVLPLSVVHADNPPSLLTMRAIIASSVRGKTFPASVFVLAATTGLGAAPGDAICFVFWGRAWALGAGSERWVTGGKQIWTCWPR